ncbi:MATE family efflux transporter [Desulforamulus ruminis]|uniref:Multidrug export protein MepA n=1 Tax=Desulforamulus ruminis (strain ATCC 23193 / DSM 2154 / NCIMB 8452 / DL) TaxID=696281 RepID=F6DK52_DESRL|nr:MATE family efflux transporter [Desulforamulus ruminis]AEG60366.1 MATE efflux family protein [Desulforamulus ruminis DSM 2154]
MNLSADLRDKDIGKLLLTFSWPAIVGMLVNSLYNIVDRIFVGQGVGPVAIAATTVAFPIMIILMAVSILIGVGATALISIRLGEQKKEEAEMVAGNAMTMLILLPAFFAILFILFTEPILIGFGASPTVLPYAEDFVSIIMIGSVFGSISMGMNNFIRAEGNPRMAMNTQILGAVINIGLNYIFIFKMGMGIKGSAWSTVISQMVSAVWVLSYFFTGRSLVKIRLKNLRPQVPVLLGIMAIGFSPFAMQVANSVQQLILNKTLMSFGGDMALSAVGIMMSLSTLLFMPILGVSQGAQPIIGYNYGARQYDRVVETLKKAVIAATVIALTGYLMIRIWPAQIVGLFSNESELIKMTTHAMMIYFAMFPVIGFQIICSGYFQAVGKARQSAILSLSRQVLLFIPLLLFLPHIWGLEGVWRTAPIADFLAVLLTASVIYLEMKEMNKIRKKDKEKEQLCKQREQLC